MHNVTMRIVVNGFDDEALHIAFGETLLATLTRDEWVLTSWCQERRNASRIGPLKEYLVDGRPVERAGDMSCLSYACEGRKHGWTDYELVIYGWSAARAPACLPCHMHAKKERTDIDAHNVKSKCNMKIVPFKGVLWLLGGARRQLHGKRPFEGTLVAGWSEARGGLVMHAKKGRTSTSTA
jgi:hypothetical protein